MIPDRLVILARARIGREPAWCDNASAHAAHF